ncbi:hypothetical protein M413DRAFT_445303 [Hebeloma cylindrosporum]|uniref:Uncharacterized protein n=1 Tax=Hebeloma cylindrosporum TaxID=76867 RepID=A0A0C3CCD5_HEBCY|nr:hypothetical protein M413DRAFT_445303 [Hebeloma cylindrosporum h7]
MTNVFLYEPFYDFERILQGAFAPQYADKAARHSDAVVRSIKPRLDLHEDAEKNLVTASFEFPGVSKEDIQIEVANGKLTVSAETKQSTEHSEDGYAVRERRFGKFSRTLQLPQGVKDDEINAAMENGVLTITFPKTASQSELAPKRIAIA